MPYLTVPQFSKAHGITAGRLRKLLLLGRVEGAVRVGDGPCAHWIIPADAVLVRYKVGAGRRPII